MFLSPNCFPPPFVNSFDGREKKKTEGKKGRRRKRGNHRLLIVVQYRWVSGFLSSDLCFTNVTIGHVTSRHVSSYHVISLHVTSRHVPAPPSRIVGAKRKKS
mmetsp:Transcript_21032/g.49655  ORF Transcript_21032/g.49655 Transcript_21032/m.49655 type:complete len:102 (+) Transcript_21032:1576-1881(+)